MAVTTERAVMKTYGQYLRFQHLDSSSEYESQNINDTL